MNLYDRYRATLTSSSEHVLIVGHVRCIVRNPEPRMHIPLFDELTPALATGSPYPLYALAAVSPGPTVTGCGVSYRRTSISDRRTVCACKPPTAHYPQAAPRSENPCTPPCTHSKATSCRHRCPCTPRPVAQSIRVPRTQAAPGFQVGETPLAQHFA